MLQPRFGTKVRDKVSAIAVGNTSLLNDTQHSLNGVFGLVWSCEMRRIFYIDDDWLETAFLQLQLVMPRTLKFSSLNHHLLEFFWRHYNLVSIVDIGFVPD